jgi:PhnB protein
MAAVKPIPDGDHAVTPYLIVSDGTAAIEFYRNAFGARERMRLTRPDGKLGHAELDIGNSVIMLADESPAHGARSPQSIGGSPVSLHLYVAEVDQVFARAVGAGASVTRPVQDQFYDDRAGGITDPFGHTWHIAADIEDVAPAEIDRRAAAAIQGQTDGQGA